MNFLGSASFVLKRRSGIGICRSIRLGSRMHSPRRERKLGSGASRTTARSSRRVSLRSLNKTNHLRPKTALRRHRAGSSVGLRAVRYWLFISLAFFFSLSFDENRESVRAQRSVCEPHLSASAASGKSLGRSELFVAVRTASGADFPSDGATGGR